MFVSLVNNNDRNKRFENFNRPKFQSEEKRRKLLVPIKKTHQLNFEFSGRNQP